MTWTKLSDDWTDRADLAGLSFEDRWHYLAMIQLCSRGGILTGEMRTVDARRCSDHPDPTAAINRLTAAGLLESVKVGVKIVAIDDHIPPPSVRNKAEAEKIRKRRQRAHQAGDHFLCLPDHCPLAPVVTHSVTRDTGTGRDGPGQSPGTQEAIAVDDYTGEVLRPTSPKGWATAVPGRPGEYVNPGQCEHGETRDGRCAQCEALAERKAS